MFVIEGRFKTGHVATIRWDEGSLVAVPNWLEAVVRDQAASLELAGSQIGPPTGPFCSHSFLESPLCALLFLTGLFSSYTVSGDVPQVPPVPNGAKP